MPRSQLLGAHRGEVTHEVKDGWPEFSITFDFIVESLDEDAIQIERDRLWEQLPDVVAAIADRSFIPPTGDAKRLCTCATNHRAPCPRHGGVVVR